MNGNQWLPRLKEGNGGQACMYFVVNGLKHKKRWYGPLSQGARK